MTGRCAFANSVTASAMVCSDASGGGATRTGPSPALAASTVMDATLLGKSMNTGPCRSASATRIARRSVGRNVFSCNVSWALLTGASMAM